MAKQRAADVDTASDERNARRPNPVDVHVGSRVRLRRMLLGMSQEKLGEHLGLTFQQIQKYEKGVNRIAQRSIGPTGESASRWRARSTRSTSVRPLRWPSTRSARPAAEPRPLGGAPPPPSGSGAAPGRHGDGDPSPAVSGSWRSGPSWRAPARRGATSRGGRPRYRRRGPGRAPS